MILASARTQIAEYLSTLIYVYTLLIILYIVLQLLFSVGVRPPYSRTVDAILSFLRDICEPFLRVFRRLLPQFGGFDFSPIAVTVVDNSPSLHGGNYATDGQSVQVLITMTNTSSSTAPTGNVTLTSVFPLSNVTLTGWTCSATGTTCQNASGSGNLNESIVMPIGAQVVFTVNGTAPNPAMGGFLTSATAADPDLNVPPQHYTASNTATGMTRYIVIDRYGFESGIGFDAVFP